MNPIVELTSVAHLRGDVSRTTKAQSWTFVDIDDMTTAFWVREFRRIADGQVQMLFTRCRLTDLAHDRQGNDSPSVVVIGVDQLNFVDVSSLLVSCLSRPSFGKTRLIAWSENASRANQCLLYEIGFDFVAINLNRVAPIAKILASMGNSFASPSHPWLSHYSYKKQVTQQETVEN